MIESVSSNGASEEFYREVRKLEARLDDYLTDEETFVKSLRECITQLKALHASTETSATPKEISKLMSSSEETLSNALINQGKAEHERSHLLESYGALILALSKLKTC
jgi:hypothetical protein